MEADEVDAPPGHVALDEVISCFRTNAEAGNPWGVGFPAIREDLTQVLGTSNVGGGAVPFEEVPRRTRDRVMALLHEALRVGTLRAIALVVDEARHVALSPEFWRVPQASIAAPLEPGRAPFDLAWMGECLRIPPRASDAIVVVPFVPVAEVVSLFGGRYPSETPPCDIVPWRDWLAEWWSRPDRGASRRTSAPNTRRGRPRQYDWVPMLREVVRRAHAGELSRVTLTEFVQSMTDWLAQRNVFPEETSVRRALEDFADLFRQGDDEGAANARRARGKT